MSIEITARNKTKTFLRLDCPLGEKNLALAYEFDLSPDHPDFLKEWERTGKDTVAAWGKALTKHNEH